MESMPTYLVADMAEDQRLEPSRLSSVRFDQPREYKADSGG